METIKTDTHLLLVDEIAEIKEGDLCYDIEASPGYNNIKRITRCLRTAKDSYWNKNKNINKVIAALPKLGDLPEFETLPPNTYTYPEKCCITKEGKTLMNKGCMERNHCEQPNTENDVVEKLAAELGFYDSTEDNKGNRTTKAFITGYKQAKSETMFSETFELLKEVSKKIHGADTWDLQKRIYEHIQSLTKPKEYEFVPEMIDNGFEGWDDGLGAFWHKILQPKIVNNKIQGAWKQKI